MKYSYTDRNMDLIAGQSYNLGLSWGVFGTDETSYTPARFASNGGGNTR